MSGSRQAWIARRSIDLVMLALLVAGILKAVDVSRFAADMRGWTLLPRWAPFVLAPAIPAIEIGLALAWFLAFARRGAAIGALALLCAFTLGYSLHLAAGRAPTCACLGKIEAFEKANRNAAVVLLRNGILLAVLVNGVRWHVRRGPASWNESAKTTTRSAPMTPRPEASSQAETGWNS